MADEKSDLEKRLGTKYRHITFVDHVKAGFKPVEERDQYYTDVANQKEAEEKARKAAEAKAKNSDS